jgi:NAD(P)-dependent dehydrogenase (short-subunit alcohol dehydrogenase family)
LEIKLRCSNVVVTGGGSGIGFAIARALIAEGAKVTIIGRNTEKLERAKAEINNTNLFIYPWDVQNSDNLPQRFIDIASKSGQVIDGFVNNAGIYKGVGGWGVWKETDEIWDSTFNINLKAPIFITRAMATYMHDNKIHGNICNVSSVTGTREITSAYGASKLSLISMTKGMAREVANMGIVINGVAPGVTSSEINGNRTGVYKAHAIGRIIEAEEIAKCVLFMMSEVGSIIIGDTLIADGGYLSVH